MVQRYNKKTIYKYKYQKIFIDKKGATCYVTPFYLFLITACFGALLHFLESNIPFNASK
jgi:hypothetical protein